MNKTYKKSLRNKALRGNVLVKSESWSGTMYWVVKADVLDGYKLRKGQSLREVKDSDLSAMSNLTIGDIEIDRAIEREPLDGNTELYSEGKLIDTVNTDYWKHLADITQADRVTAFKRLGSINFINNQGEVVGVLMPLRRSGA